MRVLARIEVALLNQSGFLFQWSPVCLASGVSASTLASGLNRNGRSYVWVAGLALVFGVLGHRLRSGWAALALGGALIAGGFVLAGARSHMVAEPVLSWRYYGPVEGRVVAMDRSASDALRVTLDRVRIKDVPGDRRPRRIRLSLHGGQRSLDARTNGS